MAGKHLTEQAWKALAVRQGVKDLGLAKSLGVYGDVDAARDPARALVALEAVVELAIKLKKALAGKADLVDHLDELLKEARKARPPLEVRAKAAAAAASAAKKAAAPPPAAAREDDDEDQEAAELRRNLKQRLRDALNQVRARAPGDPAQGKEPQPQLAFMACVTAAGPAVVIARRVGSSTRGLLTEIAGSSSGAKFYQGLCLYENNCHTFVLDKVPGGFARQLARALLAETGLKVRVRVRSTDGLGSDEAGNEDEPPDVAGATAAAVAPGGVGAAGAVDAAAAAAPLDSAGFNARLKALQPALLAAIAGKASQSAALRALALRAGELAKALDFARAQVALAALEAQLRPSPTAAGAAAAVTPQLQPQSQPQPHPQPTGPGAADTFPARWTAARQSWEAALGDVDGQIDRLQAALRAEDDEVLHEIAEFGLHGVTGNHKVPLMVAMSGLERAARAARPAAAKRVRDAVERFRAHLATEPRVQACDANPFGVAVDIQAGLGRGLDALSAALEAA